MYEEFLKQIEDFMFIEFQCTTVSAQQIPGEYNLIEQIPFTFVHQSSISFPLFFCGFGVWDGWAFCADFSLSRMDSRAAGFLGMAS